MPGVLKSGIPAATDVDEPKRDDTVAQIVDDCKTDHVIPGTQSFQIDDSADEPIDAAGARSRASSLPNIHFRVGLSSNGQTSRGRSRHRAIRSALMSVVEEGPEVKRGCSRLMLLMTV